MLFQYLESQDGRIAFVNQWNDDRLADSVLVLMFLISEQLFYLFAVDACLLAAFCFSSIVQKGQARHTSLIFMSKIHVGISMTIFRPRLPCFRAQCL